MLHSPLHALASIPFPEIDPVLLRVGPIAIRWYGLAYLLGFICAFAVLRRMVRRRTLGLREDLLHELVGWLAMGVILGGRIGWWVFYHRSTGANEPWYEPIALWRGGMSFHGGLIGVLVALVIWCRVKRLALAPIADALALVTPIGLFFGRIANFTNAELVGRPSDVPWAVVFPGETFARHPSQLYEALIEGPFLVISLWLARSHLRLRAGQVASLFLLLYGVGRFAVEFTRQPDEQLGFIAFGWLTMGQWLSALLILAGTILLTVQAVRRPPNGTEPAVSAANHTARMRTGVS